MFKEKYENAKKFVKDHKVEILMGSGIAILGVAAFKQQLTINKLKALHDQSVDLHRSEAKALEGLLTTSKVMAEGLNLAYDEIDALAELNGVTIEEVWKMALDKKYGLNNE